MPAREAVVMLGCVFLLGCGGEGHTAPEIDVSASQKQCLSLDERLSDTLDLIRADGVENLAAALDALGRERPEAAEGLTSGLLAILSELWANGVRENPGVVGELNTVLTDATPLLADVLRYLARDGTIQTNARAALSEALVVCPDASLTTVLAAVTDRPQLLTAFGNALSDPTIRDIIRNLPDGEGGGGQSGFVALVRTAARAVLNPNFVFSDLVAVIEPFFDVSQPPIGPLLDELGALLSGDRLTDLQAVAACLDQDVRLPSGQTGIEAMGALLYGLITDPDVALGERLDELDGALALLSDPDVARLIDAVVVRLQQDDALRDAMKPGLRFLLNSELAPAALSDLADLLEAGVAADVLALLSDLASDCDAGGTP